MSGTSQNNNESNKSKAGVFFGDSLRNSKANSNNVVDANSVTFNFNGPLPDGKQRLELFEDWKKKKLAPHLAACQARRALKKEQYEKRIKEEEERRMEEQRRIEEKKEKVEQERRKLQANFAEWDPDGSFQTGYQFCYKAKYPKNEMELRNEHRRRHNLPPLTKHQLTVLKEEEEKMKAEEQTTNATPSPNVPTSSMSTNNKRHITDIPAFLREVDYNKTKDLPKQLLPGESIAEFEKRRFADLIEVARDVQRAYNEEKRKSGKRVASSAPSVAAARKRLKEWQLTEPTKTAADNQDESAKQEALVKLKKD